MSYAPLPRAFPQDKGVDPQAIVDFIEAVQGHGLELHSFMLYRDGAVITEAFWRPYGARRPHVQHSATKSWTATAVGLLIDEGRLSLGDKVVGFFPELCPPVISENLAAMTVEDLLTMRTGHRRGISGGDWRNVPTSWVEAFLNEPVEEAPGKSFIYSSATSFMLSAIVTKVSGQTLHELLDDRVLRRMGMDSVQWDFAPGGYNSGGNGLSCTTEDSLKFGVLHLQRGVWEGQQLLSSQWVEEATRNQVEDVWMGEFDGKQYLPRDKANANSKREGYGYQWWMTRNGGYLASGVFGQQCIVLPAQNTVIAFTSGLRLGEKRLQAALWEQLYPGLGRSADAPEAAQAQLDALLDNLRLPELDGACHSSAHEQLAGRYLMDSNDDQVREIALAFDADGCDFTLVDHRGTHQVRVGMRQPVESSTTITGNYLHHQYQPEHTPVVAHGRWDQAGALHMLWRFVETAFTDRVDCRLEEGVLIFDRGVNTNAGSMQRPTLRGHRI